MRRTDVALWGLRGPVRIYRLERTWHTRRCGADACETEERGDTTEVEFRPDGFVAQRRQRNPDGSEWVQRNEYSDTGLLMSMRIGNAATSEDQTVYEYDNERRLVRVIAKRAGGGDRIVETYEYDNAGNKKRILFVDLENQRPDTQYAWGVEGTDNAYSAPGAATVTTVYDPQDRPIDLSFHDEAGRLLSHVEFRYDPAGNLTEELQVTLPETLPAEMVNTLNPAQLQAVLSLFGASGEPVCRTHRYDEQGRRVETRSPMGPLGGGTRTWAYNEHNDPVAEIAEHDQREYNIDEEGHLIGAPTRECVNRSEVRYLYDYDHHGNWVRRTTEGRTGEDSEFTFSTVEQRTITYYE